MFLERGNEGRNEIGRWIAMAIIVLLVSQILGSMPLQLTMSAKLSGNPDLQPNPENPLDLSAYDIEPITGFILMMIPFVFGFLALLLFIKPIHERPVLSLLTSSPKFRWKRFFWGAGVWFILLAIYDVFAIITGFQKVELQFNPATFFTLIALSLLLIPLQAGFEEVLFRGYLMQGFSRLIKYKWLTLLVTSFLFGGLHIFNPEVKEYGIVVSLSQYIWFGIVLGICTLMDEGLELAWGVHAINNIFLSVFFTQDSSSLQTPALYRITAFSPLFDLFSILIISTLFLYIARRKFQWPGWHRLFAKAEYPVIQEEDPMSYPQDEYEDDDK